MTPLAHSAALGPRRPTQMPYLPRTVLTRTNRMLRSFGSTPKIALVLLCLISTDLVLADFPAPGASRCSATSPQQAKFQADVLYEQGEYQRAGECYEAAGDASRAQLAYLKAAGPNSKSAARGLSEERDAAKALFA